MVNTIEIDNSPQLEGLFVEQPSNIVMDAQRLRKILVRNVPKLRSLDLSGPFPVLGEVDLRGTAIDDRCLLQLEEIASLRVLDVRGCKNVTMKALAAFRQVRPGVAVRSGGFK
jgi:hypothetical protein